MLPPLAAAQSSAGTSAAAHAIQVADLRPRVARALPAIAAAVDGR